MTRPGRVTLQTVADAVGVSRTTVSNAYNRPERLAGDLRERILAAAAELGYAGPDPAARRLRSGRREAVGLLFAEELSYAFTDPAAVLLLRGIARATEAEGLSVLLVPGLHGRGGVSAVSSAVVDAFCVYSMPEERADVQAALARGLPLVVVDEPRIDGQSFVGIDDRGGGRAAAEHVVALGHRRVGVITFRLAHDRRGGLVTPEREAASTYPVTLDRLAGFRDGLAGAGVAPAAVMECVMNDEDDGGRAALELLRTDPRPTALLAASDRLALGALAAAGELGIAVPDELSITGFDDIPAAALGRPQLTTVRQPLFQKGVSAGELLLAAAAGAPAREVRLRVDLVVRGSTGPARDPCRRTRG
jgi:DNA-binding LacI/PurR family transcriptional regulator